jgi:hypothetical protein
MLVTTKCIFLRNIIVNTRYTNLNGTWRNSVEDVEQLEREADGVDPSIALLRPQTANQLLNELPIFKTHLR